MEDETHKDPLLHTEMIA